MDSYVAQALDRSTLRALSKAVRKAFGVENMLYLPVLPILEFVMPMLFPQFNYDIVDISELPNNVHAETDIVNHVIRIREDVYEGAISGNGRDRMTVMHEIAHYILLVVCGVKFARNFKNGDIAAYQSPEWQAKALAGEIMCPHELIQSFTAEEVAEYCGVSLQAAKYNLNR